MIPKIAIEQAIEHQEVRIKNIQSVHRNVVSIENMGNHAFIISGIRRCGKSTLMHQIKLQIPEKSIAINFEDPRLTGFDATDFNRFDEIAKAQNCNTLFFDEIQNVPQWENYIRFKLDEKYRIFITGSNASLLSKELGTKLTGRHLTTELFPFSYLEFLNFTKQDKNEESLSQYMIKGGFPEYLQTGNEESLMRLFNDIIFRDIAVRHNIKNHVILQQVAVYLVSNIGKLITGNSLKKLFTINSSTTILEYLAFLEDCYLFQYVPKFSYSFKKQQINAKKVYSIDVGMVGAISLSFTEDYGRKLENLVFLELRRRYKKVFYFAEKKECDFVVFEKEKIAKIVQVCYEITTENIDREIAGAMEAMLFFENNEAEIITFNQDDSFTKDGKTIIAIPFYKWAE